MMNALTKRSGFSLVEVSLALGIVAICLVTIFGLLPVGLQTAQISNQQVASADIISAIIADLRATPITIPRGGGTTSPQFAINIPANPVATATISTLFFDGGGVATPSTNSLSRYRLTITFQPNGGSRSATLVNLKMTWPAEASIANATGTAEMLVALDRN